MGSFAGCKTSQRLVVIPSDKEITMDAHGNYIVPPARMLDISDALDRCAECLEGKNGVRASN